MTDNEMGLLYPGDVVHVTWGKRECTGWIVTHRNYDDDPEAETVVVYTGKYLMECIASQLTFIKHHPQVQALINSLSGGEAKVYKAALIQIADISGDVLESDVGRYVPDLSLYDGMMVEK